MTNVREGAYDRESERTCTECRRTLPIAKFDVRFVRPTGLRNRRRQCLHCQGHGGRFSEAQVTKDEKACTVCKRVMPIESFRIKNVRDGVAAYRGECIECRRHKDIDRRRKFRRRQAADRMDPVDLDQGVENIDVSTLAKALLELARWNVRRMEETTPEEFLRRTNAEAAMGQAGLSWQDIKEKAIEIMDERGMLAPQSHEALEPGTYIVVGDSHGKHTRRCMFALLDRLVSTVKPQRIIHIGHLLDDDNDASNLWEKHRDRLLVVAKREERKTVRSLGYQFVQDHVTVGPWKIGNQDLMSDYTSAFLGLLDPCLFGGNTVVNRHLHERHTRCSDKVGRYTIASPGCLCEPHIVKTIKQIDFTDGYTLKVSYPEGFIKYRRAEHQYGYWEQGVVILHLDDDGTVSLEQLRIHDAPNDDKMCCYGGRLVSAKLRNPPAPTLAVVRTDSHVPRHDPEVLSAQKTLLEALDADELVDLGDLHDMRGLNPHILSKGLIGDLNGVDIIDDIAAVRYVLAATRENNTILILANHERFADDFVRRHPQFRKLLDPELVTGNDTSIVKRLEKVVLGSAIMVHGDQKMYGASGRLAEKLIRVYDPSPTGCLLFGHVHYPAIRFGAYSVGMSGQLDQGYNEPQASQWMQGAAVVARHGDLSFAQLLDFQRTCDGGFLTYGGRRYLGDPEQFDMSGVRAVPSLEFEFRER